MSRGVARFIFPLSDTKYNKDNKNPSWQLYLLTNPKRPLKSGFFFMGRGDIFTCNFSREGEGTPTRETFLVSKQASLNRRTISVLQDPLLQTHMHPVTLVYKMYNSICMYECYNVNYLYY